MSEQVTHYAVNDDVRLLALHSPRINETFKQVLQEEHEAMRLGALVRRSEKFAGPLIRELRERWDDRRADDPDKLAFCLGTLTHRATDRVMKPIFVSQIKGSEHDRLAISIAHDIFLFNQIYGGNTGGFVEQQFTDTLSFPQAPDLDWATVEMIFQTMFQRAMLGSHTLKPDDARPDEWLSGLFSAVQNMRIDLRRYHKTLTDPDSDILERALDQVKFYSESDGIIALARDLRAGGSVEGDEEFLRRSYLHDRPSLYARALSMAYGYVQVASEFWLGEVREDLFQDAITR